jgi:acetylornithine deacetylase/succinyl-diaminopimelate desuccinylase-like protein
VARLRGTEARKPIPLLAHLDVVEAKREDWSVDPFRFLEKDGYYYGRGTTDIKDGDAILVANLIRLKREGFRPDRDLIVALTAGEEGGDWNGVRWLLAQHRDLVDAAYCVNTDGGDFQTKDGRRRLAAMQASEKLSVAFRLGPRTRGGHSSLPGPATRSAWPPGSLASPPSSSRSSERVTRAFFSAWQRSRGAGADMKAATAAHPIHRPSGASRVALLQRPLAHDLRPRLEGSRANNARPRTRATVNCRTPSVTPEEAQRALAIIMADPASGVPTGR